MRDGSIEINKITERNKESSDVQKDSSEFLKSRSSLKIYKSFVWNMIHTDISMEIYGISRSCTNGCTDSHSHIVAE